MSESSSNSVGVDSSLDLFSVNNILSKFLYNYRNTPTTRTTKSPNEMLLLYKPRTMLSQLLPVSNIPLSFKENESVVFKLNKRSPVVKGTVVKALGPNRYLVSIEGVER